MSRIARRGVDARRSTRDRRRVWILGSAGVVTLIAAGLLVGSWLEFRRSPVRRAAPPRSEACRRCSALLTYPFPVESPPILEITDNAMALEQARRLYDERGLAWNNLYRSLLVSWTVATRTAALVPRPRIFYEAVEQALLAEEAIFKQVGEQKRFAELAWAAGDEESAQKHLSIILETIPDPFDSHYQWAKDSQLRLHAEARQ